MRRRAALAAGLALALPAVARAAELDDLLAGLGPGPAVPDGIVAVTARVEHDGLRAVLVVTLEPKDGARLVADPGITVEPVAAPGIVWLDATPATLLDPTRDYLEGAAVLRLPFAGDPASVTARVDYAWCLADAICLLGEAVVEAPAG
jgi:hypothetical protein